MQKLPVFGEVRFSCPNCGALAHQHWFSVHGSSLGKDIVPQRFDKVKLEAAITDVSKKSANDSLPDLSTLKEALRASAGDIFLSKKRNDPYSYQVFNIEISTCDSCGGSAIWLRDKMIHPATGPAGVANSDMPEKVRLLFEEAGAVFSTSPRASAALLRLALQHLLDALGEDSRDINEAINKLIDQGLDEDIAKIMHSLRIIGNESVHPGVISVDDEPYIAEALFDLLNQIVDHLITRPRKRKELWESLPEGKRRPVEERFAKRLPPSDREVM